MKDKEKLKLQLDAIGGLQGKPAVSGEFGEWRVKTEETLKALFGEDSPEVRDFNAIYYTPVFLSCCMGDEAFEEAFRKGLEEAEGLLSGLCPR